MDLYGLDLGLQNVSMKPRKGDDFQFDWYLDLFSHISLCSSPEFVKAEG